MTRMQVITAMAGAAYEHLTGHWHWQVPSDGNLNRAFVLLSPPLRGSQGHNCICPLPQTHTIERHPTHGWKPKTPLVLHRQEW